MLNALHHLSSYVVTCCLTFSTTEVVVEQQYSCYSNRQAFTVGHVEMQTHSQLRGSKDLTS